MGTSRRKATMADRPTAYHEDLYAWSREQAALLRSGRLSELDALNLAEEIDDVGSAQYDKLESALAVVLLHMLKWDFQPQYRSRSWQNSIAEHRRRADRQLRRNPGLKSRLGEAVEEAFETAHYRAAMETAIEIETLPLSCPYDWTEIMSRNHALAADTTLR